MNTKLKTTVLCLVMASIVLPAREAKAYLAGADLGTAVVVIAGVSFAAGAVVVGTVGLGVFGVIKLVKHCSSRVQHNPVVLASQRHSHCACPYKH